jgi:asparagine synthase (glutamine-hydrolysing)
LCGIFGIANLAGGKAIDEDRFGEALSRLHHRGPDAQIQRRLDRDVLFGHTRLSIIDLSDCSNQPLSIFDRYWLIYNGEIFNYLELREELIGLGAQFRTAGDVEVVLHAYAHWGEGCVSRFNGMWALAIYDMQTKTLFCSRDRFGIKPFNYAVVDGQLLFASEIKAIIAYAPRLIEPDHGMIANFCRTSVGAQHAQTWFRDVRRLQPGCNLRVGADGQIHLWRYWDYPRERRSDLSLEEASREYGALFEDAVRLRMRSDVPLGITLSSGVDSNSIAFAMQGVDPAPHHSFTARFRDEEELVQDGAIYQDSTRRIDESVVALAVARKLGLTPHIVDTDYSDFVGRLGRIVYHLESGNSSPAVIPLMQLLERAREHLTVVLDGQGADELLGGYIMAVLWPAERDLLRAGRLRAAWRGLKAYLKTYTLRSAVFLALRQASNYLPFISHLQQRIQGLDAVYGPRLRGHSPFADYPELEDVPGEGSLSRRLREQHSGGLVNLLHYGDAISMANSLEARMPFLDHRLVEFVWPLPGEFKVHLGMGKYIHRQAMRGLVDDSILDEPAKYGFTTPIGQQFRKTYPAGTGPVDLLLSERCMDRGLFDREGLASVIAAHRAGRADHGTLLFRLLSVELWFRIFVDGEADGLAPRRADTRPCRAEETICHA